MRVIPKMSRKNKPQPAPKTAQELTGGLLLDAVMSSDLLQNKEKLVYRAVFEHGPVSVQQIESITGFKNAWNLVSPLRARGMIKETKEKSLTITNRKTKTFVITGNPPSKHPFKGSDKERDAPYLHRPTLHELHLFADNMAVIMAIANNHGARIPKELKKVHKWLIDGAPCPTCGKHRDHKTK